MKKPIPFGKYYLLDRISVGGMAEVFKAKAFGVEGFERLIAVKRILPSIAEDEEFITMFIDEAKIAVQLTHANIAQIFDLGKVGDSYFIAMEYVAGKDLRAIFDRMRKKGQAISIPMAAYITMKICEGLDYAHNKKDAAGRDLNLVHRDVSPQNVLVSFDGEVKLIDFGIAKAAGKAGKTQAGILKGKFGYMSPEQVRGLPLDRRSDIFAVGICLWEMVTGERLFIGESDFSTLEKVRNVEIVPPSSFNKRIPEDLEKIILKTLSKEVEDRYQSAMDLHDDLQSWMYTSGNFFARKDLGAFQQEVFRDDIEKSAASSEDIGDSLVNSTVPPPPRVSRVPSPPRSASPGGPPAPPRPGGPPAPPRPGGPPAPPRPGGGVAPVAPAATAAPAPPRPGGVPVGPPAAKRTMLGMPAGPSRPGGAAPSVPMDMETGQVAQPVAPGAQDAGIEMEWDEDEPPTNIYDKQTAAQMAKAAVAAQPAASPAAAAPPKPAPRAPSVTDFSPDTMDAVPVRPRKNKTKSMLIGVSVGVIVALLAAVVLFKVIIDKPNGSIELTIDPSDELSVVLDGSQKLPGNISPMTVDELSPGEHSLIIKRDGYKDKEVIIDVKAGRAVQTQVSLEPAATATAGFYLETQPSGCSVEVDGRVIDDKTPLTVSELEPGNHIVKVSKDKYKDLKFEVEVTEGSNEKLPLKKLVLEKVEVTFNTDPQGADVVLISDGRRIDVGKTPVSYDIETDKSYEVEYKIGKVKTTKPLEESDYNTGSDKVSLASVAIEGASAPAAVRPPKTQPPKPPTTGTKPPVTVVQKPPQGGGQGWLSVQTKPWSKVSINGRFIKNTPLVRHPLKAGKYTVTVENPGFGIKRQFRVTIKAGETTTLVQKLI